MPPRFQLSKIRATLPARAKGASASVSNRVRWIWYSQHHQHVNRTRTTDCTRRSRCPWFCGKMKSFCESTVYNSFKWSIFSASYISFLFIVNPFCHVLLVKPFFKCWMYAVNDRLGAPPLQYQHHAKLRHSSFFSPRFERVIHVVREPLQQISAFTSHLPQSYAFVRAHMLAANDTLILSRINEVRGKKNNILQYIIYHFLHSDIVAYGFFHHLLFILVLLLSVCCDRCN